MKRLLIFLLTIPFALAAQDGGTIPSALKLPDATIIKNEAQWRDKGRKAWLDIYAREIYGVMPDVKVEASYTELFSDPDYFDGKATLKEVRMTLKANGESRDMYLMLLTPNKVKNPPVVLGLNFGGNYTIVDSPSVHLPQGYVYNVKGIINDNKANEAMRGTGAAQWSPEYLISRGYALATIHASEIFADHKEGRGDSFAPMLYRNSNIPAQEQGNAIAVWAWGLSRAMDYLERSKDVDPRRVIVFGHSRLGKTVVWASACDQRFFGTIANESGCGGAALFRNSRLERIGAMNTKFPHWLNGNAKKYDGKESLLPLDQNILLALTAPRPMCVGSAKNDGACDNERQYEALKLSQEVYGGLYGLSAPLPAEQPELHQPVERGALHYHIRDGEHNVKEYDWKCYFDFFDKQFLKL